VGRRRRRGGPGSGRGPRRVCGSRRRGVGRGGGRRRRIVISSVSPAGDVSGSSPTIEAYVADRRGSLTRNDIDLYLDGRVMRLDYSQSSGTLRCPTGSLSKGIHTVEIEAYASGAGDGGSVRARKRWTFNVKK
jgi:hypothetical protein